MNISKAEQRVLHVLAQGGCIRHKRGSTSKIAEIHCVTREGHFLAGVSLALFARLKRRRLIASKGGAPYRITHLGRVSVRAQLDQR